MLTIKKFKAPYLLPVMIFVLLALLLTENLGSGHAKVSPHFLYALYGDSLPGSTPGVNMGLLSRPMGVTTAPDGLIFVADSGNSQIQVFDDTQHVVRRFGRGVLDYPVAVVFADHRIYVADANLSKVFTFDEKGSQLAPLMENLKPPGSGSVARPTAIAVGPDNLIYIADAANQQIILLDETGKMVRKFGRPGSEAGNFQFPNGIAVNRQGTIYVSDSNNGRVQIFDNQGRFLNQFYGNEGLKNLGPLSLPRGLAVGEDGDILVADVFTNMVRAFDGKGSDLWYLGSAGSGNGQFNLPNGLAVDRKGHIYVTDRENNRVQVFDD